MRNSDNFTAVSGANFWKRFAAGASYLLTVGAGFTLALAAGLSWLEG